MELSLVLLIIFGINFYFSFLTLLLERRFLHPESLINYAGILGKIMLDLIFIQGMKKLFYRFSIVILTAGLLLLPSTKAFSTVGATAADLIKKAMIQIHDRLERDSLKTRMLLQVHDELLFEVWEDELDRVAPFIKKEMEGACELAVPLRVDIKTGRNWDEAH